MISSTLTSVQMESQKVEEERKSEEIVTDNFPNLMITDTHLQI